jgi:hypothetical protein
MVSINRMHCVNPIGAPSQLGQCVKVRGYQYFQLFTECMMKFVLYRIYFMRENGHLTCHSNLSTGFFSVENSAKTVVLLCIGCMMSMIRTSQWYELSSNDMTHNVFT